MSAQSISWVAEDPVSRHLLEIAEKLADTSTTLLITGESGTGKDQLARWIHERGPRRDAPLLKIDCASLPAELVESELFGHERGAFTSAEQSRPGLIELAAGGVLFLDGGNVWADAAAFLRRVRGLCRNSDHLARPGPA